MKHAVPEIRRYQPEDLKAAPEDIRAVILIGSSPSYPKFSKLCSSDGQIECLAAPPHTASFAQGIIVATKRIHVYRRKCLEEGLVLMEGIDEDEGTRGHKRLEIIAILDRQKKRLTQQKIHSCLNPVRSLALLTVLFEACSFFSGFDGLV
jgi:hypothetical protein